MNNIARRVYCACTGDHTFRYERSLFNDMKPATLFYGNRISDRIICTKCGAYVVRYIKPDDVENEFIHLGPDARMYQYWQKEKE